MSRMSLLRYGLPTALLLAAAGGAWGQTAPAMPEPPIPAGPPPATFVPPPPADTASAPTAPPAPPMAPPPQSLQSGPLPPVDSGAIPPASALVPAGPPPSADAGPPTPADAPPPPVAPPPVAVQASPLTAPDLFATGAGSTGLPSDLWKGASADLARQVIPMLSARPLSPAASAFGRRLMSAAGPAPAGAGQDVDLGAARIGAVLALGDAEGAHAMLEHTAGVRQSPALSQIAAEADFVLGHEDQACAVGDALSSGKDAPYWRRLRAYCLLKAGDNPGAQLAFDLAAEQAKDDVYKRLMAAAVSGSSPGDASLRNGMEYALSKRLMLDLAPAMATAWAPIPPAAAKDPAASPSVQAAAAARVQARLNDVSRASGLDPEVRDAALSLADNKADGALADALATAGGAGGSAQAATALYVAAGAPASARVRAAFAGFDIGPSKGNQARLLEMDTVSAKGDAALLALWLAADAGEAGPVPADRARIVRALNRAGFRQDARAYALEGLLNLQPPPPAPPPAARKPPAKAPPPHKAPARKKR